MRIQHTRRGFRVNYTDDAVEQNDVRVFETLEDVLEHVRRSFKLIALDEESQDRFVAVQIDVPHHPTATVFVDARLGRRSFDTVREAICGFYTMDYVL